MIELDDKSKQERLDAAIATIQKAYGKGSITSIGSGAFIENIPRISSGSISIDNAIGGGWPKGRVVEVYGPESSGKTTISLHAIAEAQRLGGVCAFIDAEHALDPTYARKLGVDTGKMLISQPDNGEQALEIVDTLTKSGCCDVIVVDSVASLVPQKELEGEMGDSHMGLQARMMSQALRKLTGAAARTGTTIIFINQLRMKIGVFFGNPETTTGGNALKFYASIRVDIRSSLDKTGTGDTNTITKIKVVKNKTFPPYKQVEFKIKFGQGIDKYDDLLNFAVSKDVIKKSGAWYSYGETRIGQGATNTAAFLKENPDTFDAVMLECKEIQKQIDNTAYQKQEIDEEDTE